MQFLAAASEVDEQFAVAPLALHLDYRSTTKGWMIDVNPDAKDLRLCAGWQRISFTPVAFPSEIRCDKRNEQTH
jgi:hypothetical protein